MPSRKVATKKSSGKAAAAKSSARSGRGKASASARNQSSGVTSKMDEGLDRYRAEERRKLAIDIIRIIGVRTKARDNSVYVSSKDMEDNDAELLQLLGRVKICYSSDDRQALYKNNKSVGKTLAKMVLSKEFPSTKTKTGKGALETSGTFQGLALWKVHSDAEKYAPPRDRVTGKVIRSDD